MLSACASSWLVCSAHASVPDTYARSAYASVPDAHAQCTYQFLRSMLRVYKKKKWENWCAWSGCASVPDPFAQCVPKTTKNFKSLLSLTNGLESATKIVFAQIQKSFLNLDWAALNEHLNIYLKNVILTPKLPPPPSPIETLWCNSWKSDRSKISHLSTCKNCSFVSWQVSVLFTPPISLHPSLEPTWPHIST